MVVEAQAVGKQYGNTPALREVSLGVAPGEFIALMGRSGCGKSTLLNLLGAMDTPSQGRVLLAGEDTRALTDNALTALRRRVVGFVFQAFHLLPTLTVQENIEMPLRLAGASNGVAARARELAAQVEMTAKLDAFPRELSGGELQRVAIARALVHQPRLVLADEPTGNLDSHSAALVLERLASLAREQGSAVVMATHSAEAAAIASRVLHLRDGCLEPAAVSV
ncbi:MAG: ABC transporter ATP-binding protein [Terriglobales bacterium]